MREPVFLLALAIAAATVIVVVKSIAGAISGRGSRAELGHVREELERHAAALDDAESRLVTQSAQLAELQERLDFAERLFAQSRDRTALGPGETRG